MQLFFLLFPQPMLCTAASARWEGCSFQTARCVAWHANWAISGALPLQCVVLPCFAFLFSATALEEFGTNPSPLLVSTRSRLLGSSDGDGLLLLTMMKVKRSRTSEAAAAVPLAFSQKCRTVGFLSHADWVCLTLNEITVCLNIQWKRVSHVTLNLIQAKWWMSVWSVFQRLLQLGSAAN